jgi:hypothetical protein
LSRLEAVTYFRLTYTNEEHLESAVFVKLLLNFSICYMAINSVYRISSNIRELILETSLKCFEFIVVFNYSIS